MVAPHQPTDAEPWTAPPPGSVVAPPPRRWRKPLLTAAAVLAVVVVAVAAGALLRDTAEPADNQPAGDEPVDSVDRPAERPQPTDEDPDVDPELARLRASDRYLAIAEHQRASVAESPIPGDPPGAEAWALFHSAEGEYANKEALWDEVVRPIRDDALLAGEPYTDAIWNEDNPADSYVPVVWYDATTEGRGDTFTFAVRFRNADGEPVERIHAVLIRSDAGGMGEVAVRMSPLDLRPDDAQDFPARAVLLRERVWTWVQEQATGGADQ